MLKVLSVTSDLDWIHVPDYECPGDRFLRRHLGRRAELKKTETGWTLHWQCLRRICPDQEWDCETNWSKRQCEPPELALKKADEILSIEWPGC